MGRMDRARLEARSLGAGWKAVISLACTDPAANLAPASHWLSCVTNWPLAIWPTRGSLPLCCSYITVRAKPILIAKQHIGCTHVLNQCTHAKPTLIAKYGLYSCTQPMYSWQTNTNSEAARRLYAYTQPVYSCQINTDTVIAKYRCTRVLNQCTHAKSTLIQW